MREINCLKSEYLLLQEKIAELEQSLADANHRISQELEPQIAQLTAQNSELEAIVNAIPDLVFQMETDSTIVSVRTGDRSSLYLSPQEFIGKQMVKILPHPAASKIAAAIARVKETQEMVTIEYSLPTSDREEYYEGRLQPFGTDRVIMLVKNISDRKRAEEELQVRDRFLSNIYAGVSQAIFVLDVDETSEIRFAGWNLACEKATGGISSDRVAGKTPIEVFGSELGSILLAKYQTCLQAGKTVFYEEKLVFDDGIERWFLTSLSPLRDERGKIHRIVGNGFDISDRKAVEQALRESERKYQQILDAITDMILVKGPKSRIVWANKAFREYYGMTNEELQDLLDAPFNEPDYTLQYIRDDSYVFQTGKTLEVEEPVTRYDGTVRIFNTIKSAIRNEQDEIILTVGVSRDISDRKQAEEKLASSQAELLALFNAMQDVIIVLDREGRYIKIAPSGAPLLYKPPTEMCGKTMHEVLPTEAADIFLSYIQQALSTQKPARLEYNLPVGDRSIWFDTTLAPMQEDKVVCVARDITDRKRQVEALRLIVEGTAAQTGESFFRSCTQYLAQVLQVRYALIAEFSPEAPDRAKTLAFWAGEDFIENFEYQLGGTPCGKLYEEQAFRVYCNSVQSLFPEDVDLITLNAESYAGIPILDNSGYCLGHIAVLNTEPIVRDTETQASILGIFAARAGAEIERMRVEVALRRSENQLRQQARELEQILQELRQTQSQLIQSEKMSSLGQMVAGVAHEINNPISFIHGNLVHADEYIEDLLRLISLYEQYYPEPNPAIKMEIEAIDLDFLKADLNKLFSSMQVGTNRIRDIVKSLRNFSRLDEAEYKEVNIHEGIESTLMILQNRLRAQSSRSEIQIIKQYDQLPLIECYAGQLNQALLNIITNAIDALEERERSRPQTEIMANPSSIQIHSQIVRDNWIAIGITDNGIGIGKETQAKLFDPFFTTKPIGKGTGLGLAIAYQIVTEKHNGKLFCHSVPGETCFTIEIPIRQTQ